MIRVDMQTISKSSRNTSGVYIVKGDEVASISRCIKEEKDDEDENEVLETVPQEGQSTLELE